MVSIMACRRLFVIYSLCFIIQLTNAENSWDNRSLPKPFVSPSSQVVHRTRIKVKERIEKSSLETSCSSADVDDNFPIDTFLSLRGGWSTPIAFSPTAASMLAGSFAGAIGVGVSFPLDTLKTKSQVLGKSAANLGMVALSRKIFASEGIRGFFGGVRGMMVGQAIIKSIAFSSNRFALGKLSKCSVPTFHSLLLSAAFAGFVTSFIVAPIERVKIMMQANTNLYKNEIECIKAIFKAEGFRGFLGRGLNPTIVREVPSYCIYFALYGVLMSTPLFMWLGSVAPLVGGALRCVTRNIFFISFEF